jgi:hypothetical protein
MSNEKFETKTINKLIVRPFNKQIKRERIIDIPLPDFIAGDQISIFYINSKIGSGKSVLVANLLHIYKHYFKKVYFCSSNIEFDEKKEEYIINDLAYKNVFKFNQERLFNDFNDKILKIILDDIKETKEQEDYDETEDIFLLIVDDLSSTFLKINSFITKTMLRLRHIKLCVWIISQSYKNINPRIRTQISYFISFKTQNNKEIDNMSETIGIDSTKFKELLNFATDKPHSFLLIDSSKNPPKFYKNLNEEIILK